VCIIIVTIQCVVMWLVVGCTVICIGNFIVCDLNCAYNYSYCIVCCYVVGGFMYSEFYRELYCVWAAGLELKSL
jgi:hypothetical protein